MYLNATGSAKTKCLRRMGAEAAGFEVETMFEVLPFPWTL